MMGLEAVEQLKQLVLVLHAEPHQLQMGNDGSIHTVQISARRTVPKRENGMGCLRASRMISE